MKHVLFIHYFFLPVHNVAVKRLVGYARHLPSFGWRARALTRQWRSVDEADPSWGLTWEPDLERESGCMIYRVAEPAPSRQRFSCARQAGQLRRRPRSPRP